MLFMSALIGLIGVVVKLMWTRTTDIGIVLSTGTVFTDNGIKTVTDIVGGCSISLLSIGSFGHVRLSATDRGIGQPPVTACLMGNAGG